jgi:hypothetical protein
MEDGGFCMPWKHGLVVDENGKYSCREIHYIKRDDGTVGVYLYSSEPIHVFGYDYGPLVGSSKDEVLEKVKDCYENHSPLSDIYNEEELEDIELSIQRMIRSLSDENVVIFRENVDKFVSTADADYCNTFFDVEDHILQLESELGLDGISESIKFNDAEGAKEWLRSLWDEKEDRMMKIYNLIEVYSIENYTSDMVHPALEHLELYIDENKAHLKKALYDLFQFVIDDSSHITALFYLLTQLKFDFDFDVKSMLLSIGMNHHKIKIRMASFLLISAWMDGDFDKALSIALNYNMEYAE